MAHRKESEDQEYGFWSRLRISVVCLSPLPSVLGSSVDGGGPQGLLSPPRWDPWSPQILLAAAQQAALLYSRPAWSGHSVCL